MVLIGPGSWGPSGEGGGLRFTASVANSGVLIYSEAANSTGRISPWEDPLHLRNLLVLIKMAVKNQHAGAVNLLRRDSGQNPRESLEVNGRGNGGRRSLPEDFWELGRTPSLRMCRSPCPVAESLAPGLRWPWKAGSGESDHQGSSAGYRTTRI